MLTGLPLFPPGQDFHAWIVPERVSERDALHCAGRERRKAGGGVSICMYGNILINREVARARDVTHKACNDRAEACRSDSC